MNDTVTQMVKKLQDEDQFPLTAGIVIPVVGGIYGIGLRMK